jgi:hypothetical protein
MNKGQQIRCAINPHTGREYKRKLPRFLSGLKAMIVGGGPAGIQQQL